MDSPVGSRIHPPPDRERTVPSSPTAKPPPGVNQTPKSVRVPEGIAAVDHGAFAPRSIKTPRSAPPTAAYRSPAAREWTVKSGSATPGSTRVNPAPSQWTEQPGGATIHTPFAEVPHPSKTAMTTLAAQG